MRRTRISDRIFTSVFTYRLIIGMRSWFADLLPIAGFFAVSLAWEALFNHARPAASQLAGTSGLLHAWVRFAEIPAPPAVIAAVIFAVGLRIGRPTAVDVSSPAWLARRVVLYLGAALLAGAALRQCAGGFLACYLPFAAGLVVPWRLRKRRLPDRKLRRPTRAGFRPSVRALLSFRGREALGTVDIIDTRTAVCSATVSDSKGRQLSIENSVAEFRARGDHRSEAYCLARAVGLALARAKIADAEMLSRGVENDEHLSKQPAAIAARADFLAAVGQYGQALVMLVKARELARKAPPQLQARILEVAVDAGRYDRSDKRVWSVGPRIRMIWSGEAATVIVGVAASVQLIARTDSERALKVGYQLCKLPDRLAARIPAENFDLISYQRALAGKGMALDVIARIYRDQGRLGDASAASLDAYETYNAFKNSHERVRAARSFVRSLVCLLAAGPKEPEQESHALDLMRALLQLLEDDRGTLLGEESRSSWITAQRDLYRLVFAELAAAQHDRAKAGELGFWLLESLHRTMTADLLADNGVLAPSPALLAKLTELTRLESETADEQKPQAARGRAETLRREIQQHLGELREAAFIAKPTNAEAALALLGDRHAILYHCWREPAGWAIQSALVSPQRGIQIHTARITAPGTEDDDASWTTAVGALDALKAGDPIAIGLLLASSIAEQPWPELTEAILPKSWWDVICPEAAAPIELLVVPDGPIAGLPLAAMPVRNGKPLLYYATVAMTPALSLLRQPAGAVRPHAGVRRSAVVHLDDDTSLPEVAYEAERWQVAAQHMNVVPATSQAALEDALTSEHPPDVVAISVHGYAAESAKGSSAPYDASVQLRGGSRLSTTSALRLPWPPNVILGACWVSGMRTEAGSEPYGFPVACLLRGATTVLGGIAPIPDVETARILGDVIDSLPSNADIPQTLRHAQEAEAERTLPADTYPAQIAGLVAWTLAPASRPATLSKISLHWNTAGLAPQEAASRTGTYVPDPPLGDLAARTLTYSRYLAKERQAGTLEYLTAAMDIDNADWTGFLVACELGPPSLPGSTDESAAGTVMVAAEDGEVAITAPLSQALRRGQLAADYLKDEVMLPRHVVLAALCDADSAASRWITSQGSKASLDWHRHLGERIFRAALPKPGLILGLEKPRPEVTAPRHQSKIAGATLKEKDLQAVRRPPKLAGPLVAATLIVLITASQGNANQGNATQGNATQGKATQGNTAQSNATPARATTDPSSALGIVFAAASSRGAVIATVLPASPAARAGLMTGEIVTAVDGSPITSLSAAKDALDYRQPGTPISLSVLRGAQRLTVRAIIGQPLEIKDPGYVGVELRNQPINGVLVVTVAPGGPAAVAGLHPGDIITAVSGQPDGGSALGALLLIQSRHPGQLVRLSVIRGHRRITINIVAGQQPGQ